MKKILLLIIIILFTGCINGSLSSDNIDKDEQIVSKEEETGSTLVFDNAVDVSEDKEEYRYILLEIRIRSEASKKGDIVGHVYEGEHYKVLETKVDEDLTWYRIGDSKWIADDGTWTSRFYHVHFKSNNGSKEERIQEYGFGMDDMMMDWMSLDYNRFYTDNYVFVGWNTLPDGSGTYYHETEAIRHVCGENSDVYLYAQWVHVKEKDVKIKAVSDLSVMDGPSYRSSKVYGVIRDGDCFSILESIEYDGKIWDRIATDSWIVDQRDNMEILDEYPYDFKNINAADYHLPKSIEQVSYEKDGLKPYENDSTIIFTFNYNLDGSLSYVSNDYKHKGNGAYEDDYSFRPYGSNSIYYYGDNVENEFDSAGKIVRQTITNKWIWNNAVHTSTTVNEYTYSDNVVVSKLLIQDVKDRSADIIYKYKYNNDNQLVMMSSGMANSEILNSEKVFEYNGNMVFEFERRYSTNSITNKQEWSRLRKWGFYRYDVDGKIIEARDDYGIGAPDYAYYYHY